MKQNSIIKICLGLFLLLATTLSSLAQTSRTVTGSVVDEAGEPIIGATIMVAGTTTGTVTDIDGKFSLPVPEKGKLTISYIGYTTQTITNLNNPKVILKEDVAKLDEVVIVGYGSQKMKNVTGAIETVNPDDLKDLSVGSLGDALAGMVNGLHVSAGGGRPGSTPSLQIRQSSINTSITPNSTRGGDANPSPLYVIDDFIATEDAFNNLDVSEVENITILKDASAAVYGARAAYGVVLVKTKRGKIGAPKISYAGQFGFTDALDMPDMLSAYDYGRLYNITRGAHTTTKDELSEDVRLKYFQADELEAMKSLNYDILDKEWSAALTQRHSGNINGGTEKATYFAGLSYYNQEGNIGRLDYDRWNFRAGVNANISKWVKASLQVAGDYGERNNSKNGIQSGGSDADFNSLMTHLPFVPDQINGHYIFHSGMENSTTSAYTDSQYYNFAAIQAASDNVKDNTENMSVNGSLEYDFGWFKPLQGLKVKASYSRSVSHSKSNSIGTTIDVYQLLNRSGSGNHLYTGLDEDYNLYTRTLNNGNQISRTMTRNETYQMNLTVSYARQFGLHNVSGLFSIEKSESEYEDVVGVGTNPVSFTDGQSSSVNRPTDDLTSTFSRSESGMLSYIGRVNYSYADKYLFEFLLRSDASSKFAPKNYWGVFPSVSAGWVISEESWFNKEKLGIDFLKIRGSFGLLGRDNIQPWIWTQLYARNPDKGPIFGINSSNSGTGPSMQMPKAGVNANVHWDKTYKTNIGLDIRMLDNKLSVTLDGYYDMGRDLFAVRTGTAELPSTVGTQATPENFGEIDTYGAELTLGWKDKIGKDFSYWVKMTTGYSDNKIKKDGFPAVVELDSKTPNQRADRGLWGLECIGMFRSYQEIDEYFDQYGITTYLNRKKEDIHPGMLIYKDVRGPKDANGNYTGPDGIVDATTDRIQLSHRSSNPYGFTLNFGGNYKEFSFSAQFGASWGAYSLVQTDLRQFDYNNLEYKNVASFWKNMFVYEDIYDAQNNLTVEKDLNAKYPTMGKDYTGVNNQASSFWKVSAASVTLRNITLAYSLPKNWMEPIGISSCRLNLTCQNAISFYNPYPGNVWSSWAGTYGKYPNLRKFTLGVNVSF